MPGRVFELHIADRLCRYDVFATVVKADVDDLVTDARGCAPLVERCSFDRHRHQAIFSGKQPKALPGSPLIVELIAAPGRAYRTLLRHIFCTPCIRLLREFTGLGCPR
ncbi:hypothetical protein D9M68_645520 [compost metagenome]